jgi:hypothetical protein
MQLRIWSATLPPLHEASVQGRLHVLAGDDPAPRLRRARHGMQARRLADDARRLGFARHFVQAASFDLEASIS